MLKSETFNMDCLEYLRSCKDKQFSCAIADPPYSSACLGVEGNAWKGKYSRFGGLFTKYHDDLSVKHNVNHASGGTLFGKYSGDSDAKNWDSEPPAEEFWNELFRVCDWLFIWGGNYFNLPPSRNWIVWEKTIPENFSMAMVELCWTSVPGNAKIIKCRPQDKFRFHPTQKHRVLYDKILEWYGEKYCKPKGILDPFLGSGSSRIAAWDAGIDFVGIELNKVYFQKQEIRFSEHITKGNLYDSDTAQIAESAEGLF
jgi:site-specific DNA-methyltransferase (adenine-specific)